MPSPTTSKYMDTSIHPLSLCIDIDKSPIWEALDDSANEQAVDGTQEQDQDPPPAMDVEDVDGEHVPIVLPRLLCKRNSKFMDALSDEEPHHQEPIKRVDEKIAATDGTIVINDTETIDSDMYVLGSFSTEASEIFGAPNLIHPRPVPFSCIVTPSQLAS